jgi:hypothetical protein
MFTAWSTRMYRTFGTETDKTNDSRNVLEDKQSKPWQKHLGSEFKKINDRR